MMIEVAIRFLLARVVIIKIFSPILYILHQSPFHNTFFVRRMNVAYALIPEKRMLPDTKYLHPSVWIYYMFTIYLNKRSNEWFFCY